VRWEEEEEEEEEKEASTIWNTNTPEACYFR
jgi:hypothetical protein